MSRDEKELQEESEKEEFGELLKFTAAGFLGGHLVGANLFWVPPLVGWLRERSYKH